VGGRATKRILIVTAGFGEGHNSAARNLAGGFAEIDHHAEIADPCLLGAPLNTRMVSIAYRFATTHMPRLWLATYRSTDRIDFSRERRPIRNPRRKLGELIDNGSFDALVATYPLYPYLMQHLFDRGCPRIPVFTVVTDSIVINSAWRKAPTDYWLVTDASTRDAMVRSGLPQEKIIETGFPVHPGFVRLSPVPADDPANPFRILYFPTSKAPYVRRIGAALLAATGERGHLTIVLGRNFRRLYRRALELKQSYGNRVTIKGWTRKIPELMCSHHLVVGKAGGATVHEAIAAQCPMIVHHLVPGQEEGNLALLEKVGGGRLATTPQHIATAIRELLADGASAWRHSKRELSRLGRRSGTATAARFIIDHC